MSSSKLIPDLPDAIIVRCYGGEEFKEEGLLGWRPPTSSMDMNPKYGKTILIRNNKMGGMWQPYGLVEYHDFCPVDGKLMHVYAIEGTTWIACCSTKCYDEWHIINKKKESGELSLHDYVEWFDKNQKEGSKRYWTTHQDFVQKNREA